MSTGQAPVPKQSKHKLDLTLGGGPLSWGSRGSAVTEVKEEKIFKIHKNGV